MSYDLPNLERDILIAKIAMLTAIAILVGCLVGGITVAFGL